jgi:hypothetical protein
MDNKLESRKEGAVDHQLTILVGREDFRETIGLTFLSGSVTLRVSAFGTLCPETVPRFCLPGPLPEKVRSRFSGKSAPTDTQGLPDELGVNVHGLI